MKFSIISVDYQNDFCTKNGKYYLDRPCHAFIETQLVPFLKNNNIKIAEILCDFRSPRPQEKEECCIPGEWGYLSAIDDSIKLQEIWNKSTHSPDWVRENGGVANKKPGVPYQDPKGFTEWLERTIGSPEKAGEIILFGLTLECCVLNTAIQLHNRNYQVKILKEGTDIFDLSVCNGYFANNINYKDFLFATSHREYSNPIEWEELKNWI